MEILSEGTAIGAVSQTSPVVSSAEVARMTSERVWVSSPSEMPHLGCLGRSAFWEAGTQAAEAGIAS